MDNRALTDRRTFALQASPELRFRALGRVDRPAVFGCPKAFMPAHVDGHCMRTIAVVEDDPSMLQGVSRLLAACGFHVDRFTSAESFLDDVAKSTAVCLVVDIHLGGISGIDLKRQLTSLGSDFPVIFMTAIDSETTRQEAYDVGCVAYLRKPFRANLLIEAINRVA